MDVTVRRYAKYADVLDYCRYSANPVGRLILTLFGYRDDALYGMSDAVCTALQLANHWQDVAVDLKKDRVYLPEEDMARFGVSVATLVQGVDGPGFRALLSFEVERARGLFKQGKALPECVTGRLRYELRSTWHGGARILEKIDAVYFDVFRHRPVLTKWDWFLIASRALRPA
jgi:phytoene synthase